MVPVTHSKTGIGLTIIYNLITLKIDLASLIGPAPGCLCPHTGGPTAVFLLLPESPPPPTPGPGGVPWLVLLRVLPDMLPDPSAPALGQVLGMQGGSHPAPRSSDGSADTGDSGRWASLLVGPIF